MSTVFTRKPVLLTLLFYACSTSIVGILLSISPSGPCTPGLGVLAFFLLFILSIFLFFWNAGTTLFAKKNNGISALIHLLAAVICLVLFF